MQSNKVQSILSVLRFLFTVVFYVSLDCVVLQCFEQSPYNLIPYVSIYPDISNIESSHRPQTKAKNISLASGSGRQPPEATCRDLWMEVVLKLVAVALVKVPQRMSMWVGRQIISFDIIWHELIQFFSRLVKPMASNQSLTVLLFLDIVYDTYHIALTQHQVE